MFYASYPSTSTRRQLNTRMDAKKRSFDFHPFISVLSVRPRAKLICLLVYQSQAIIVQHNGALQSFLTRTFSSNDSLDIFFGPYQVSGYAGKVNMITHVIILYDLAVLVGLDLLKLLRQSIKPLFTNTGIDEFNLLHLHTLYIFRCDYVCFAVIILWDENISCLLDFYSACLSPVLKPQSTATFCSRSTPFGASSIGKRSQP